MEEELLALQGEKADELIYFHNYRVLCAIHQTIHNPYTKLYTISYATDQDAHRIKYNLVGLGR